MRGGRVWSGASGLSLYPMKDPSLFRRKYRGLQVLMYSPETRQEEKRSGKGKPESQQAGSQGDSDSQEHHTGKTVDNSLSQGSLGVAPADAGWGTVLGLRDPQVTSGRKTPQQCPRAGLP